MKLMICASKYCYKYIPKVKDELEGMGHTVTLPNCYEDPMLEERIKEEGNKGNFLKFKRRMFEEQEEKIRANDGVVVLNYEKNGQPNYVGGSTFLEMFKAFELDKKIYLMNPSPDNILKDEIEGMNPVVLNGDVSKIS